MGRILFLSAVAFLAYKYISKSNERHQALPAPKGGVEVLPPPAKSVLPGESAIESVPEQKVLVAASHAAEPEPHR